MYTITDEAFEKLADKKVLVIGDIILDANVYTSVSRVSPEAPVPVAKKERETFLLGGAANVAMNAAALGLDVTLVGGVGNDESGKVVGSLCAEKNITLSSVEISQTIVKKRILARGQQLVRLDEEDTQDIDANKVFAAIGDLSQYDIILVSDYQKGIVTPDFISQLEKANTDTNAYIGVDTKPGSFVNFSAFSLVKPNFSEAVGIARKFGSEDSFSNTDNDVAKLGTFLREKLNTDLLITRSEEGATFIGDSITHHKLPAKDVLDVTGGGDTSLVVFSCFHACGLDPRQCLEIMNAAAAITVSHVGIYAPTKNEIIASIQGGLVFTDWGSAKHKLESLKKQGKKIAFTNGCFDILHRGHIQYLHEARSCGDYLVVGLNSDSSVQKLKGPTRPIVDEESRGIVLSHLQSVDMVVIFSDDTPIELLKVLQPDVFVKGGDYTPEQIPEIPIVESLGGTWKILSLFAGNSTTSIVEKIKKQSE